MPIEAFVRLADQPSVEPSLSDPGLIRGDQQDGPALGVEGESGPPDPAAGGEAELLHVGVARPLEGVGSRAAQCRPEGFEELRVREQFVLYFGHQGVELRIEVRMKDDFPSRATNMTPDAYAVKRILGRGRPTVDPADGFRARDRTLDASRLAPCLLSPCVSVYARSVADSKCPQVAVLADISSRHAPPSAPGLQNLGARTFFRQRDAAELGVGSRALRRLVDDGSVERVTRGLYRVADAEVTEHHTRAAVCARVPSAVVCLLTA